jgi:hypothetical protein
MTADQRGVTLAETMVAVGVIGLGLAGFASMAPIASHALQAGQHLSTATFLAEQRLEQARRGLWSSVPPRDCLGLSSDALGAPTSLTCTRPAGGGGIACAPASVCPTFPDETNTAGFSGYVRTTRVQDCHTPSVCGDSTSPGLDPSLRLVTVTVTYIPPAGHATNATLSSTQLSGLVARK